MDMIFGAILLFIGTFFISYLLTGLIIWLNQASKIGQSIREEGPSEHFSKAGTATLGGFAILATTLLFSFIFLDLEIKVAGMGIIILFVLASIIGAFDDLIKINHKQNQGLFPRQKLFFQVMAALIFLLIIGYQFGLPIWLALPSYIFMILVIIGGSNAANLTDGLDGLLGGITIIFFLASAVICAKLGAGELSTFSVILAGSTTGFLMLNLNPAKIFMGDVGSLGIGAVMAGIFVALDRVWWLPVIAIIPVIETLSVMLQVSSFKLTGKRLLKMSPIHHHFEKSGYSEKQIVTFAWIITFVAAIITVIFI
jgi:phospho-N-acetylmuramoyl-pentapeptide-transferase